MLLAIAGCGDGTDETPRSQPDSATTEDAANHEETPMDDATTLPQNIPTTVDGSRVVAYNVRSDGAALQTPDGRLTVSLDEEIELGGTTYRVAETVPHSDEREGARPNGWVSLVRE